MREVKFRGLLQTGKLIFGSYVTDGKDYHAILRENPADSLEMFNTPVIPESVNQFTGLQDKNGVDIYEGDIVNYKIGKRETNTSQITFSDYRFVFNNGKYGIKSLSAGCPKIKVIGNIHQNPELLESVK